MKRIKVMLTAIAIFAVVGGALAFKANSGSFVYCATVDNQNANAGSTECPLLSDVTYVKTTGIPNSYCTFTVNTPCTVKVISTFTQQ